MIPLFVDAGHRVVAPDYRLRPLGQADATVRLEPGACTIEGAGHFLQEDKPDELAAAVLTFMANNPL